VEAVLPVGLGTLWLLGFGTVVFAWGNRWRIVSHSARNATLATEGREFETLRRIEGDGKRGVPLLMSSERTEPGIFGIFRPVLVWPEQLSEHLDDHHIEAIVAHELTHVRRRDNLTALIHMLVEAAFWFNPLVWWIERQMVKEREQACDEAVVAMGSSAETYAESLLRTCWFCIESPLPCVAGVTGADLKRRVADIITGRALLRMTWPKKLLLATVAICAIVAPVVLGQAKAAQRLMLVAMKVAPKPVQSAAKAMIGEEETPGTGEIAEQTIPIASQPIPAVDKSTKRVFDVSTVKPADPNARSSNLNLGRDDIKSNNLPVLFLLQFAYGLNGGSKDQIVGAPAWVSTARFDIDAKMDETTAAAISKMTADERVATLRGMLQTLLAERFSLVVHRETQALPVLALTVARGGTKLVSSAAAPTPQGEWTGLHNPGPGQMEGRDVTISDLTSALSNKPEIDGRLVIDQTGLRGKYNFALAWAPENARSTESADTAGPSLFTALKEQLGLQLEGKKAPVDCIVIDHLEKPSVDGAEVGAAASASSDAASPSEAAQRVPYVPTMTFDVASVRESKQDPNLPHIVGGSFQPHSTHLNLQNVQMYYMITMAYGIDDHQIEGLPNWGWTSFNIEAKSDSAADDKLAKLDKDSTRLEQEHMLQALLSERFHLEVHWVTEQGPIYNLVLAKGGPKLLPAGSMASPPEEQKWLQGNAAPP